jgi:hypothetical protein
MHRFFAIMAVCGVGSVTASTLAQTHRSAEVSLRPRIQARSNPAHALVKTILSPCSQAC